MKIVSTGYTNTPSFTDPEKWLNRISFYTGILEELAKKNEVESIEQINYRGQLQCNGVKYHFLNFKNSPPFFSWRLNAFIKKLKPDAVLVNGFIFPLQIIQLRLLLGSRVKIAVINRAEKPGTGSRKFLQQLADRFVQCYFFTSKEMGRAWVQQGIIKTQNKIAETIQASSAFYVMDKAQARAHTAVTGTLAFLWAGRLDANKDPLTVLSAFAAFIKQQPSAKLYMIYQTEDLMREVKILLEADKDLAEAVELVGEVPHREMQYWYSSVDFIISGSHYEGSGIAVCEAMSCGCVPIVTKIQSFRKMTAEGSCGLLYQAGNAEALLKVLLQTMKLDIETEKNKVLQQFNHELSFTAIANKMEQAIASL